MKYGSPVYIYDEILLLIDLQPFYNTLTDLQKIIWQGGNIEAIEKCVQEARAIESFINSCETAKKRMHEE